MIMVFFRLVEYLILRFFSSSFPVFGVWDDHYIYIIYTTDARFSRLSIHAPDWTVVLYI